MLFENQIRILDTGSWQLINAYQVKQDIQAAALDPTGALLAITFRDRSILVIDIGSGRIEYRATASDQILNLTWSDDGRYLIANTVDQLILMWHVLEN